MERIYNSKQNLITTGSSQEQTFYPFYFPTKYTRKMKIDSNNFYEKIEF